MLTIVLIAVCIAVASAGGYEQQYQPMPYYQPATYSAAVYSAGWYCE